MGSAKKYKTHSQLSAFAVLSNANSKHFIREDYSEIGRSRGNFLYAHNTKISIKHCVIEKSKDNKFTICDMSNYGTFVNNKRLIKHQAQELNHLDRIKLADLDAYSYVFYINKKHLGIKGPKKTERDELDTRCKAEIEELKMKLEKSGIEHQQFIKELQERLEETKNVLLERDEQVKGLEKKQKEKQELLERVKKEIKGLEEDLMCNICTELYIEPTALNCGHMFCKLCITEWSKTKKNCPICSAKILTTIRILIRNSVIQRRIRLMPEETLSGREALIAERKKGKSPPKKQSAKKSPQTRYPREPRPSSPYQLLPTPRRLRDVMSPTLRRVLFQPCHVVPGPQESEGDDPFRTWLLHSRLLTHTPAVARIISQADRNSPVTVAAIDLTIPMIEVPSPSRARTHTVTSADANNTTIDLTCS